MPKKNLYPSSSQAQTYQLSEQEAIELGKCYRNFSYFIHNYCYIYDSAEVGWVKFNLWPDQEEALDVVHRNQLSVILKARQLGMTWCVLAYALWSIIFRPIASILLFSKRDTDAIYLVSEDRLMGMYNRLPAWMRDGHGLVTDNAHEKTFENESAIRAFPTSAGDSYTATLAIVDEADLAPDLNALLRSVKPTIDNGGKMVLLSRADKDRPVSDFKRIYMEAKKGTNGWAHIFLPWFAHPRRTQKWYEQQKADIQARTGSLDDLFEQYPADDSEALKPRSMDKRIPHDWLAEVFEEENGDDLVGMTGLTVYRRPEDRATYVIGADTAEGNPNSDPSSATVLNVKTGEEVALLTGRLQPSTFAENLQKLARFYNDATVLVERNNHGHAVLLKMMEDGFEGTLDGFDGRPGWHNTTRGKSLMYSHVTDAIKEKDVTIHSFSTYQQLASIVGSTLKAPDELHDDEATGFALAQCGRLILTGGDVGMTTAAVHNRKSVDAGESSRDPIMAAMQGNRKNHTVKTISIVKTSKRMLHVQ